MASAPIRALAVDVDGTVTDYQRRFSVESIGALRAVEAKGVPVILATGNVAPIARAASAFLGLSGPDICENGGVLYWLVNGRARMEILHDRKRCDEAFDALIAAGHRVHKLHSDLWRYSECALDRDTTDEAAVRSFVERFDGERLKVVATEFAVHIMPKRLSKFASLRKALDWLNEVRGTHVSVENVLAIGDSNNDVELADGCGYSATVANGRPALKERVDYVAKKEFGAGVEEILRHFQVI